MTDVTPNQARIYQISAYYRQLADLETQTTEEPLKTLYQLLLQELHVTLQQFQTS
jgi:hypothetical protein